MHGITGSFRLESHRARWLILATILALSVRQLDGAKGVRVERPALTLRVVSEPSIDSPVLLRARKESIDILGRAGILLVWLPCDDGPADVLANNPCSAD